MSSGEDKKIEKEQSEVSFKHGVTAVALLKVSALGFKVPRQCPVAPVRYYTGPRLQPRPVGERFCFTCQCESAHSDSGTELLSFPSLSLVVIN